MNCRTRCARFLGALALMFVAHLTAPCAAADSDELARGRALFTRALELENSGKFGEALDTLERVREIRDTPQVRYRMGACLAGLSRYRDAVLTYERAASLAESTDPPLAESARERVRELAARIPELTVRVAPGEDASKLSVRLDGNALGAASLGTPFAIDPGPHRVLVNAPGRTERDFDVVLRDAEHKTLVVQSGELAQISAPAAVEARPAWPAWVAFGGSALFVAAGAGALVVRANAIGDLHEACPGNRCAASRRDELTSTRDRAVSMAPVSVAFFAVAGVAAGFGGYWLATRSTTRIACAPGAIMLTESF